MRAPISNCMRSMQIMFWRKVNPDERRKVLELLVRWSNAISRIDIATDLMRQTMVKKPLGIQSFKYEVYDVAVHVFQ